MARLDAQYYEYIINRTVWLIEMKYLSNIGNVDTLPVFDFEYLFDTLHDNEKKRREEAEKKEGDISVSSVFQ